MSLLLVSAVACSSDDGGDGGTPTPDAGGGGGTADAAPGAPDADNACAESTLSYTNFGENFVTSYCTLCHSAGAANRQGAPSNVNFDSYSDVMVHASRMRARAGVTSGMPVGLPKPSQQERDDLVEWIDCGLAL